MQPDIEISATQWQIVNAILSKVIPRAEVWAFGSRARKQAKPYSDLDLAVLSAEPMSLSLTAELKDAFSESDLPWKVDIVDWTAISAEFREIINKDKVLLQSTRGNLKARGVGVPQ